MEKILSFFRTTNRILPLHWMIYDGAVAAVSYYLASLLILRANAIPASPSLGAALVAAAAAAAGGNILGLYERKILVGRITLFLTVLGATAIVVCSLALFMNLVLYEQIGRWVLALCGGGFFLLAVLPRFLGHSAVRLYNIRILVLADGQRADAIAKCIKLEEHFYEYVGYCSDRADGGEENVGVLQDIPDVCRRRSVDQIVVTGKYVDNPIVLNFCFEAARLGCEIQDESSFYESFLEQVQVGTADKGALFTARVGKRSRSMILMKRAMDIAISLVGLILAAPVFLVVWLVVRLTDGGPTLYTQERSGRFGKSFRIIKFRTMVKDAEKDGAQWAVTDDPRVTPFGSILRKTRLDEIPQFWNILKGDMSLVGPRPERTELVREIEKSVPYFSFRHWARPGLTGLAQIRFRYSASMEDAERKLCYDLYYIKNWSLFMDAQIILRTISTIMKGAR